MLPFLLRCVRYKCGLINTIQDVLRQRPGWVEVKEWVGLSVVWSSSHHQLPCHHMCGLNGLKLFFFLHSDGEWDFNWCDVGWLRENFDHSYMEEHVRINHFRNHYEVRHHQSSMPLEYRIEISTAPTIYNSSVMQSLSVTLFFYVPADSQKPHGEKPQKTQKKPWKGRRPHGGFQMWFLSLHLCTAQRVSSLCRGVQKKPWQHLDHEAG